MVLGILPILYEMENKNVRNHQPDLIGFSGISDLVNIPITPIFQYSIIHIPIFH